MSGPPPARVVSIRRRRSRRASRVSRPRASPAQLLGRDDPLLVLGSCASRAGCRPAPGRAPRPGRHPSRHDDEDVAESALVRGVRGAQRGVRGRVRAVGGAAVADSPARASARSADDRSYAASSAAASRASQIGVGAVGGQPAGPAVAAAAGAAGVGLGGGRRRGVEAGETRVGRPLVVAAGAERRYGRRQPHAAVVLAVPAVAWEERHLDRWTAWTPRRTTSVPRKRERGTARLHGWRE